MLHENLVEEFIFDCEIRNLTKTTIKNYKNNNLRFAKYMETKYKITNVRNVDADHVKDYIRFLLKEGKTTSYVIGITKALRAFFKYIHKEGYINKNIMLEISWIKQEEKILPTFTDDEVRAMIDKFTNRTFIQSRNKLIIMLFADTGIRAQELCDIKLTDVQDEQILIHGKGRKERFVPLTPIVKKQLFKYQRALNSYCMDMICEPYLFVSFRGKQLTGEALQRVVRIAYTNVKEPRKVRASPHTFRHYYAQTQLMNGLDMHSLSRLLGHNNFNVTREYLKSLDISDAVERSRGTSPLSNI